MMKEEFHFRRLKKDDVQSAVELVRNSFNPIYLIPSIYRAHGIAAFIRLELENQYSPYEYYIVSGSNNSINAFAEFKILDNIAFLNIIATSIDQKKAGVANLLFEHCRKGFVERAIRTIELDVFGSNTVACGWYEKLGFKEIGKQYLYMHKCNLDAYIVQEDFRLLNYSQFSTLSELFGFSFLEFNLQKEYYKIGVIGNLFIVRCPYSEKLLVTLLCICHYLPIEGIYFLVKDANISGLTMVDSISKLSYKLLYDDK